MQGHDLAREQVAMAQRELSRGGPISYRVKGAAAVTGLSERSIWRAIERRELGTVRVGRATLILADTLENWLASLAVAEG